MSGLSAADEVAGASGTHALRTYGRYEILGEIARGGMGIVYLARLSGEGGFSRLFGLKVMHPHLAEQDGFARLMMREAKLAASIHHPNVVSTVDFGMHEGSYFMVLDYIEGSSLGHACKATSESPPRLFIPCVIDALHGLYAAHSIVDYNGVPSPIVHQDVSPDNILVGIDGVGRITDFGIAREVQQTTYAGNPKGKAAYMSPEQLTGRRVDVRADLWSMGVVLWNLLTGEKLFSAGTAAATIYNVLHLEIPLPSTVGKKPPQVFDQIVMRALQRDQDERFASADEMAQALEDAAKKVDALAPRSEVGRWIQASNPDELKRRRDMVRKAGTASGTLTNSSPSGSVRTGTPAIGMPHTVTSATVALDDAALAAQSIMSGQLTPTTATGKAGASAKPGVPRSVAVALVAIVVALAAWVALHPSESPTQRAQAAEPKAAPASATAPVPPPVAAVAQEAPAAPEPAPVPAAPTAEPPREVEAPPEARPNARIRVRPRPAQTAHSASSAEPKPAPAQPNVQIEANPYLRQE